MEETYAIKITNLKKKYQLGQIGSGTLYRDLASWWARIRGKEDPNLKIGHERFGAGESFWAINGIDLTVSPGEAVGIIGKNGAGKSTLLKLLSHITTPSEGRIEINGRISSMLEVGSGFHGEMTGRENVYMNGTILGMSKAEIDQKMDDIIEFSEIGEFIDTPVKRYSSGMYVKLAFSVAAHLDSEIMIMDEVLAVGDMLFQKKCLDKMKSASQGDGRTVLYVSHNMSTIRSLCQRCIVLDEGRIIYDGDVEKAIEIYMGSKSGLCAHKTYEMKDYLLAAQKQVQILETHLDHEDCQYAAGQAVSLRMKCQSTQDLQGVHVFFQIVSHDGVRVGSSFSPAGFDLAAHQPKEISISIPTSEFYPAQYLAEIGIYTSNRYGSFNYLNTLKNSFQFEIMPAIDERNQIGWHPNRGHVHFQDFELTDRT